MMPKKFDEHIAVFGNDLLKKEIRALIDNNKVKVLQCSKPVSPRIWRLLNDMFFSKRPDVQLRVYGFYGEVCDLSFLKEMKNVRRFSADCLMDAKGIENIALLENLESLGVGSITWTI